MQKSKRVLLGVLAATGLSAAAALFAVPAAQAQTANSCFTNINNHPGAFGFNNNNLEIGTCQNYPNLRFHEVVCPDSGGLGGPTDRNGCGGNFNAAVKRLEVRWQIPGGNPKKPQRAFTAGLTSSGVTVQGCTTRLTNFPTSGTVNGNQYTFNQTLPTKCNGLARWSYDAS